MQPAWKEIYMSTISDIKEGKTSLGIELGSTRVKAVLIGSDHTPIASGDCVWENRKVDGWWTYTMEDVWNSIQKAYAAMAQDVQSRYEITLESVGSIGISGMMHGYIPFNKDGEQICIFRIWRNTRTAEASKLLTDMLQFNIPQRWSSAHLTQAILNGEEHVKDIAFLTTLAGYVHWRLTGEKAIGIGEASGMFPVTDGTYDRNMAQIYDAWLKEQGMPYTLEEILPPVKSAGEPDGQLTEAGAALLDPTGMLKAGIPFCPPEGDAGTGMAATNSVRVKTGNISAGTSIFSMIVLEKPLAHVYSEVDMVTTPDGMPVAMIHCNTCSSDIDSWVNLFSDLLDTAGAHRDKAELYPMLYKAALEGDPACDGLMAFNCYAGEPVIGTSAGTPVFMRRPDVKVSLASFMRTHLYSAIATLCAGNDLLLCNEHVEVDQIYGHGGFFKTKGVGQKLMADALNVPVTVMETAGEGGPWGMALLAAYMREKEEGEALCDWLDEKVFRDAQAETILPNASGHEGFEKYKKQYLKCVEAEKKAAETMLG